MDEIVDLGWRYSTFSMRKSRPCPVRGLSFLRCRYKQTNANGQRTKRKRGGGRERVRREDFDVGWILDRWWSLETRGGKRKVNQKEHEQDVGSRSESSKSFRIPKRSPTTTWPLEHAHTCSCMLCNTLCPYTVFPVGSQVITDYMQ